MGMGQGHFAADLLTRPSLCETPAKKSGDTAYRMAGITPQDIDVALLYDCFTYTLLVQLEDYGFCAKGEGGPFVEAGNLEPGGNLPTNTSGGLLSEVFLQGWVSISEAVEQLRGSCGPRQVEKAEIALVSNNGGYGLTALEAHATLILRN
jgi:acetyl-CoA acetyltransferase